MLTDTPDATATTGDTTMSLADRGGSFLRTIDTFSPEEVAEALRHVAISDKARTLVVSHASAPDRAMSRLELARSIGSESVNSCNSVYGTFARRLALALDPTLESEWKPRGEPQSDWVMFLNRGPARWTEPTTGEPDEWVFAMREALAHGLELAGIVPFTPVTTLAATDALAEWDDIQEERGLVPPGEWLMMDRPSNPLLDLDEAFEDLDPLPDTEREAVVAARVGQGQFRDDVVERWQGACAVSGTTLLSVLVASHIKPWADSDNAERLDPANGLLLVGTLDRLFDAGLITFEDDGGIRISGQVSSDEQHRLAISPDMRLRSVPDESRPYLAYHREYRFAD